MDALEVLAILILTGALLVLVYYYLLNNTDAMNKVKSYIPSNVQSDGEEEQIPIGGFNILEKDDEDSNTSMGEKIKIKFKDMPNFGTDAFSKRIDSFLDEKSDELIREWSLATKDDVDILEKRCELTYRNIDELTKRFNEYREFTNERLDNIDERLKKLEEE